MISARLSIAILMITSLFLSCEKTVIFDVETKENQLVVNSVFGPGAEPQATVSLSLDPLSMSDAITFIDDATIRFYKNDIYLGDFNYSLGLYTFPSTLDDASASDIYKIEVDAPGRESVSAETTIPAFVMIETASIADTTYETIQYSTIDSMGNLVIYDSLVAYYELEVTFTDPEGLDYYSLEVEYRDAYSSTYTCFATSDPVFTFDNQYNFGDNGIDEVTVCGEAFFTDITFEQKKKTITLKLIKLPTEFTINPQFYFKLKHLSKEYHQYVATTELQGGNSEDPFAEPVVVFSNINNGFGIFAGYSISTAEIDL